MVSYEDKLIVYSFANKHKELELLLRKGIKWDKLFNSDIYQDSLSYVYYTLENSNLCACLPPEIFRKLRKKYLAATGRNILFLSESSKILKALNTERIPVLVLKGIELLNTVYKKIGTREITDIDFLIHPEDLKKSEKVLSGLGYSFLSTNQGNHNVYCKDIIVELHWDIVNKFSPVQKYVFGLDVRKVWENATPIKISGCEALVMSPEDDIVYLSCHLLKEFYSNFKWLGDIYLVIKTYQINWDKLVKKAREFRVVKPVYYALKYVDKLFEDTVPESVLTQLVLRGSFADKILLSLLFRQKTGSFFPEKNIFNGIWRFFLYFSVIRFSDKLRALKEFLKYIIQNPRRNSMGNKGEITV